MDAGKRVAIAEVCPSGAIRCRRNDGRPNERPPPVNLTAIREGGPYAVRGDIVLEGRRQGFRMTLCRGGASNNKPFCDCSHHDVKFGASGEPPTGQADMRAVRDGPLNIDPETDGPIAGARRSRNHRGNRPCRGAGSEREPLPFAGAPPTSRSAMEQTQRWASKAELQNPSASERRESARSNAALSSRLTGVLSSPGRCDRSAAVTRTRSPRPA